MAAVPEMKAGMCFGNDRFVAPRGAERVLFNWIGPSGLGSDLLSDLSAGCVGHHRHPGGDIRGLVRAAGRRQVRPGLPVAMCMPATR